MKKSMSKIFSMILTMTILPMTFVTVNAARSNDLRDKMLLDFKQPSQDKKSTPLWFWNKNISEMDIEKVLEIMDRSVKESGYSGFGILPEWQKDYLSEDYFKYYGAVLDKAKELGLKMCLYDENGFPSGPAGGLLAKRYPESTVKRLDMISRVVKDGSTVTLNIPKGTFMGGVAMNTDTFERIDISDKFVGQSVTFNAPQGNWKVMGFVTVKEGNTNLDYLDPTAVRNFINITHEEYYKRFPDHFGSTINTVFYDEPSFMTVTGTRLWTPSFNDEFEKTNGYSPTLLYPALFMDIGEETQSARTAMFGMRTEMFTKNYIGQMNDWCADHNIELQGHMLYEEVTNPTGIHGDLMKVFKYQDIPGVDVIGHYGYTQEAYKIISSSANNWDKKLVMSESYGAINNMPINYLYKIAMDEYTKGINRMIPHAVWYDDNPADVTYQPELSYRNPIYATELPIYNNYIGRLNTILQSGRHVVDIGMLYPIYDLNASYKFDGSQHNEPYFDYMQIGEHLSLSSRKDFTYIHPEVLDEKCTIDGKMIRLNNDINFEQYKVMIMPGAKTVSLSNLQKIKLFYDNGGKVIATTQLPYMSAESGKNAEVVEIVKDIFGVDPTQISAENKITYSASSIFSESYSVDKSFDGMNGDNSRWNAASASGGNQWLEVDFGEEIKVNRTVLMENAPNFRINNYDIQYWDGSSWKTCAHGNSVGSKKENTFNEITTSKLRLYINSVTVDSATIEEFGVYYNDSKNLAIENSDNYNTKVNENGGKSYFLEKSAISVIDTILNDALAVYDVEFSPIERLSGGNLQYIHKVINDSDVYFIGNSSDSTVETDIQLRGTITPEVYNPMDGSKYTPEYTNTTVDGLSVTVVKVKFNPVQSLFIIDQSNEVSPVTGESIAVAVAAVLITTSSVVMNKSKKLKYIIKK